MCKDSRRQGRKCIGEYENVRTNKRMRSYFACKDLRLFQGVLANGPKC